MTENFRPQTKYLGASTQKFISQLQSGYDNQTLIVAIFVLKKKVDR
jgi:hypothetical protein